MIGVVGATTAALAAILDEAEEPTPIAWEDLGSGDHLGRLCEHDAVVGITRETDSGWRWWFIPEPYDKHEITVLGAASSLDEAKSQAEIIAPLVADLDKSWEEYRRNAIFLKMLDEPLPYWGDETFSSRQGENCLFINRQQEEGNDLGYVLMNQTQGSILVLDDEGNEEEIVRPVHEYYIHGSWSVYGAAADVETARRIVEVVAYRLLGLGVLP